MGDIVKTVAWGIALMGLVGLLRYGYQLEGVEYNKLLKLEQDIKRRKREVKSVTKQTVRDILSRRGVFQDINTKKFKEVEDIVLRHILKDGSGIYLHTVQVEEESINSWIKEQNIKIFMEGAYKDILAVLEQLFYMNKEEKFVRCKISVPNESVDNLEVQVEGKWVWVDFRGVI